MFNREIGNNLKKIMCQICQNNKSVYRDAVTKCIQSESFSDEDANFCLKAYYSSIQYDLENLIKSSSTNAISRYHLARTFPEHSIGISSVELDNSVYAGVLYALAYYAFTNKPAKPKDVIFLNHHQAEIQVEILNEFEEFKDIDSPDIEENTLKEDKKCENKHFSFNKTTFLLIYSVAATTALCLLFTTPLASMFNLWSNDTRAEETIKAQSMENVNVIEAELNDLKARIQIKDEQISKLTQIINSAKKENLFFRKEYVLVNVLDATTLSTETPYGYDYTDVPFHIFGCPNLDSANGYYPFSIANALALNQSPCKNCKKYYKDGRYFG